jgi:hypothetical protein
MGIFYKHISKRHLQKLFEERDYYLAMADSKMVSDENREEYDLMADFYKALIEAAEEHIVTDN